jgi:hydroxymethylpyrimidine/phosphomethylpyrimidine kinase
VLAIAGVDPSGGAGIQADLEAFGAVDVHGRVAVTALTAQTDRRVSGVFAVPASFVADQIEAAFDGAEIDGVKIGMLANASIVRAVATTLARLGARNIVVDPVLRSSSGAPLLDDEGLHALRTELVPIAAVITPNAAEAGLLAGVDAPTSVAELHDAARALSHLGSPFVLVTGGHVQANGACVDVLLAAGRDATELEVPRARGGIRGSGCRLSSAIAAHLALGIEMRQACALAQRYVAAAIESGAADQQVAPTIESRRDRRSLDSLRSLGVASANSPFAAIVREAGSP